MGGLGMGNAPIKRWKDDKTPRGVFEKDASQKTTTHQK